VTLRETIQSEESSLAPLQNNKIAMMVKRKKGNEIFVSKTGTFTLNLVMDVKVLK
jgi:hypothetical protein